MATYSVTLTDYTPSPRSADAGAWTSVRWEQLGASRRGTPTILETQTVDFGTDPTTPNTATDLTTELATIYPGWFRLVALDTDAVEEPTAPFFAGSAIRPTVNDVARRMPDRTTVDGGSEARTFNDDTTPTGDEVEQAIDDAVDIVDPRVPPGAAPDVERAARQAVTLEACLAIEAGNWGEQIETNDARVALWERLLTTYYATLDAAANEDEPGQARFGSLKVLSPTLTSYAAVTGFPTSELLP